MINDVNWQTSLKFVWRPENDGQGFHVSPNDPGGDTNHGVIQTTWSFYQDHGYIPTDVTLAAATLDQLETVLYIGFWQAGRCDQLPPGVDLVAFNMNMASGTGRGIRILQQAVGVKTDGIIGDQTLTAVNAMAPAQLVLLLTERDEQFFAGLTTFKWFGRGWDRRAEDCKTVALAMAAGANSTGVP